MSKDNGHLELKVGKRVTKVRKCATRLELSGFASLVGELVQANSAYQDLKKEFEANQANKEADPTKRIEAFSALAELDRKFTERTAPLFRKILADLAGRQHSGDRFEEYEMAELAKAAGEFISQQSLAEEERKN